MLLIYYFYRRHLVGRGEKSVIDLLAQKHPNQRVNLLWFLDYEPIKHTMQEVSKLTKLKWLDEQKQVEQINPMNKLGHICWSER